MRLKEINTERINLIDNDSITQLTLTIPAGKKMVMEDDTQRVKQPNYYRVGNGTMNRDKIKSMDFIQELIGCTKPAQTVLGWIKDGMVWNRFDNRIDFVIKVVPETSAGKKVLAKGFKELSDKDLVRRVKRSYYMINPNAIITDYQKQMKAWTLLNKESEI